MRARSFVATAVLAAGLSLAVEGRAADGFDVVALGALGGIQDGNLSAWLVHPHDDDRAVTFDAGTLVNGLRIADEKGAFDAVRMPADSALSRVGTVLTNKIKGYLVSHAHLDHVAGLVIASPERMADRPFSILVSGRRPNRIWNRVTASKPMPASASAMVRRVRKLYRLVSTSPSVPATATE